MPIPRVVVNLIDLTARVPAFPGVYGAMVIDAPMGPVDTPVLVTSEDRLFKLFTPFNRLEIGYSETFESARAFLTRSDKLWMIRATGADPELGGVVLQAEDSSNANAAFVTGYADKDEIVANAFGAHPDSLFAVYAATPGDWSDDFRIAVVNHRFDETLDLDLFTTLAPGVTNSETGIDTSVGGGNVDVGDDEIDNTTGGIWTNGDAVRVTGTDVVAIGLALNTIYYIADNAGSISFHTTKADAVANLPGTRIALTDAGAATIDVESVIDVVPGTDEVQLDGLTLSAGHRVKIVSAGTLPSPLTTGQYVFVAPTTAPLYKLYPTEADAIADTNEIDLTTVGDGSMTVEDANVIDISNDTFKLPGNTWVVGESVQVRPKTGATLPTPLSRNSVYYLIADAVPGRYKLATSRANAIAGTAVNITAAGSGDIVLTAFDKVSQPGASEIRVFHARQPDTLTPVETWVVSRNPEAIGGSNQNIFIENVLLQSLYIRGVEKLILDPSTLGVGEYPTLPKPTASAADGTGIIALNGGSATAPNESDYITAVNKFENPLNFPLTVFMDGGYHNTAGSGAYERAIITLCENRGDCVAFLSTPIESENNANYLDALLDWRNDSLPSSSYAALYTPHLKTIDANTGVEKFVSPEGYAGSALSFMAFNQEIWFPLAGAQRGNLPQATGVNIKFTTPEADLLHDIGRMNPIMFVPGAGVRLVSQITLLTTPSDLQNLNVRLLLVAIIPGIKTLLDSYLQEFNTEQTRLRLTGALNAYMNDIRARQGVFAFQVICDSSNNPSEIIDAQKLVVDLFIEPAKGVNEIRLTVGLVRTGGITDLQIRVA